LVLLSPKQIDAALTRLTEVGALSEVPNRWQIEMGVLRMWHRILFRSETIGTCSGSVRNSWRARWLEHRPVRFPFLVYEQAIRPWDLSGLLTSPEQLSRHLIGAHHDGQQCIYDLQILSALYPEHLPALRAQVAAVISGEHPRAQWLQDLTVYEGYHQQLLDCIDAVMAGEAVLSDEDDPDISFLAYMRWCTEQPKTPRQALRAGLSAARSRLRPSRVGG